MRCNKAREYLSLEFDGGLPPDSTRQLSDHLDSCGDCREYRADLQMGQRILQATEPQLPDNFDWKLQLKLNQALKETVGDVAYPWEEAPSDRWRWFRNFGSAAAVGMAAVLALAIFFGPTDQTPNSDPTMMHQQPVTTMGNDRLPLDSKFNFDRGLTRTVSSGSPLMQRTSSQGIQWDKGWSGNNTTDLRTIQGLRGENIKLKRILYQTQRQNLWMRAQLDTNGQKALDLEKE